MKRHSAVLLICIPISVALPVRAQANRWMRISANDQIKISADTTTLMKQPSSITMVWVKTEFATPQRVSDKDTRVFVSSVNRYKLDCSAGTESIGPGAFYSAEGLPVMAISSGYTPWQEPTSGTPAEDILTRVCDFLRSRR